MPGTNLTREEAATRATLVTVQSHDVDLDVTTGPQTFSTRSTIRFTCSRPGAETFLDFVGGTVEGITVNGTTLDPADHHDDSRIRLTGLASDNEVVVTATGRYTNTGVGPDGQLAQRLVLLGSDLPDREPRWRRVRHRPPRRAALAAPRRR